MHVAYVLAFDVIDVANGDPYHGSSTSGGNSCVCASVQVKYDSKATEVDLLQPAFTRRREVFVGRLAMVGFVSAVFGEVCISFPFDIFPKCPMNLFILGTSVISSETANFCMNAVSALAYLHCSDHAYESVC